MPELNTRRKIRLFRTGILMQEMIRETRFRNRQMTLSVLVPHGLRFSIKTENKSLSISVVTLSNVRPVLMTVLLPFMTITTTLTIPTSWVWKPFLVLRLIPKRRLTTVRFISKQQLLRTFCLQNQEQKQKILRVLPVMVEVLLPRSKK